MGPFTTGPSPGAGERARVRRPNHPGTNRRRIRRRDRRWIRRMVGPSSPFGGASPPAAAGVGGGLGGSARCSPPARSPVRAHRPLERETPAEARRPGPEARKVGAHAPRGQRREPRRAFARKRALAREPRQLRSRWQRVRAQSARRVHGAARPRTRARPSPTETLPSRPCPRRLVRRRRRVGAVAVARRGDDGAAGRGATELPASSGPSDRAETPESPRRRRATSWTGSRRPIPRRALSTNADASARRLGRGARTPLVRGAPSASANAAELFLYRAFAPTVRWFPCGARAARAPRARRVVQARGGADAARRALAEARSGRCASPRGMRRNTFRALEKTRAERITRDTYGT